MAESEMTVVGSDSQFKGELTFNTQAKIVGKFEGQINGKGELLVASGAQCKADVAVGSAQVDGVVQGNLRASEVIKLNAKGVVHGDITAAKMIMTEGASFHGKCAIGPEAASKAPGAPQGQAREAASTGAAIGEPVGAGGRK